jgi:ubiquitin-protein ligase
MQAKQQLPPGIEIAKADDFQEWQMDIRVMDANPLYLNQIFRLRFRFGTAYPIGILFASHVTHLAMNKHSSSRS